MQNPEIVGNFIANVDNIRHIYDRKGLNLKGTVMGLLLLALVSGKIYLSHAKLCLFRIV